MIQHPAVIALIASSFIISCMVVYAGWYGTLILWKWDLKSGSELQLNLERRTYLISTIISYALVFQILSLFLYIYTADDLHGLFTGAMCAAGTLHVDGYGYPALILKTINCIFAGVWLIINHTDTRGYDYPLIKVKYALLDILAPMVILEAYLQFRFFSGLRADIITSCCGSLFSADKPGFAADIVTLPYGVMEPAFFGCMAATIAIGIVFYIKGKRGCLFSAISSLTFLVSAVSLISFICLYFYELPTHHCPFCILQREYGYIGYVLYSCLLAGGVAGIGVGVLMPFRCKGSLIKVIPAIQHSLAAITMVSYLLFTVIVSYRMLFSNFRLCGV